MNWKVKEGYTMITIIENYKTKALYFHMNKLSDLFKFND